LMQRKLAFLKQNKKTSKNKRIWDTENMHKIQSSHRNADEDLSLLGCSAIPTGKNKCFGGATA
jgi:hypothetical protein